MFLRTAKRSEFARLLIHFAGRKSHFLFAIGMRKIFRAAVEVIKFYFPTIPASSFAILDGGSPAKGYCGHVKVLFSEATSE